MTTVAVAGALFALTLPMAAETTSLAGVWGFRYDADSKGEAAGWEKPNARGDWLRMSVPGSYDQALRNNVLYQGKGWYRREFSAAPKPGERLFLRFDGVAIRAKVWINGKLAGEHRFPYTGFEFDVTELVRGGANTLVVLADNQLLERAIPDVKCTGWWNYGGINRGVWLETRPRVSTGEIAIATRMAGGGWTVDLTLTTRNSGEPAEGAVAAKIFDAQKNVVWSGGNRASFAAGATESKLSAKLARGAAWSPESPALYTLEVATRAAGAVHQKTLRFGLRQIEVKGTRILLNGKPVFLRGVNYHEMYPGAGMTLTREQVRRDLLDMKAMGSNFVRLAHYSHARQAYELADEIGLMVWSEIPAWQTNAATLGDDEVWEQYGAPQLRETIAEHRTHPSVVVWSVGNEFPSDREPVAHYVERACRLVRQLDPTRLVTFASDRRERDISFGAVDFIAVNEYYGWYYGNIHDLGASLDAIHRKWPDKPMIVSEFGSEGVYGWKNPAPADSGFDYSEDYQIKLISTHLRQILDPARREFMHGAVVWVWADFPNPSAFQRRGQPPVVAYMNCKGLVTDDRRHKRAYEMVKGFFLKVR